MPTPPDASVVMGTGVNAAEVPDTPMLPATAPEVLSSEPTNVAFNAGPVTSLLTGNPSVDQPNVGTRHGNALPQGIVRDLGTTRIEQAFYTMTWPQLVQHRNAINTRLKDLAVEAHNLRSEYSMVNTILGFRMMTELANRRFLEHNAERHAEVLTELQHEAAEARNVEDRNASEEASEAAHSVDQHMTPQVNASNIAYLVSLGTEPSLSPQLSPNELEGFALPISAIAGNVTDPSTMGYGESAIPPAAPYERNVRNNPSRVPAPEPKSLIGSGRMPPRPPTAPPRTQPVIEPLTGATFCGPLAKGPKPPPVSQRGLMSNNDPLGLGDLGNAEGGGAMRRVPSPAPSVATEATVEETVMFSTSQGGKSIKPADFVIPASDVRPEVSEIASGSGESVNRGQFVPEPPAAVPLLIADSSVDLLGIRHPNVGNTPVESAAMLRGSAGRSRTKSPKGRRGLNAQGKEISGSTQEINFLQQLQDELECLMNDLEVQGHVHPTQLPVTGLTKCINGIPTELAEEVFLPYLLTFGGLLKPRNYAIAAICVSYDIGPDGSRDVFNGRMYIKFRTSEIAEAYSVWLNGLDCFGGRLNVPNYQENRDIDWQGSRNNAKLCNYARFGEKIWEFPPSKPGERNRQNLGLQPINWMGTSPIVFALEA